MVDADWLVSDGLFADSKRVYMSTTTIKCKDGSWFSNQQMVKTIHCTKSGNWSLSVNDMKCEPVTCEQDPVLPRLVSYSGSHIRRHYGAKVVMCGPVRWL